MRPCEEEAFLPTKMEDDDTEREAHKPAARSHKAKPGPSSSITVIPFPAQRNRHSFESPLV